MYKAKQEIQFNGLTIPAGGEIDNPTTRMKELGLVEKVAEKTKKKTKKKAPKKEILTEESSNVEVSTEEKGFFDKITGR